MKKRYISLIISIALLLAVSVVALADNARIIDDTSGNTDNKIMTKQNIYDEENGTYVLMEDYKAYIKKTMVSTEDQVFDSIPVYEKFDILTDNEGVFYPGLDSGLHSVLNLNTRRDFTSRILSTFPTKAIRNIKDTGNVYAVYDTNAGERIFLFFSEKKNDYSTLDGFPIIMMKRLEYKDFETIEVGCPIDMVRAIDPVVSEYIISYDSGSDIALENYTKIGAPPTSIHLLTDGILKIEYKRTESDDYVITDIVYGEDFILEGLYGETCYRIADVDYISN